MLISNFHLLRFLSSIAAKNRLYPPYSRSSSEGEESPIHKQQQQQHYTRPYVAPNMNLVNGNPHHVSATMNNNLSNPKLSSYAKNRSQSNTLKGPNQISTLSHSNHKPSNLSTNLITPTSSENNSELTFTDTELAMARDNTLLHKGEWSSDYLVRKQLTRFLNNGSIVDRTNGR